jgi:CHAT domain-containing protein
VEDLSLIHYLSAERDLVERRQGVPAGRGLLAIGNPDFGRPAGAGASLARAETDSGSGAATRAGCGGPADWTFDPLPGADQEVREVAALWRARPSSDTEAKVLTGPRATESAFKRLAPGRRVLHLATHGYFLGADCAGAGPIAVRGIGGLSPASGVPSAPQPVDRPLHLSGLALAGANRAWGVSADPEDGVLTAEEIATLDLSGVEWVTLSACDTGTGEVRAGEGVFGLRRAFHLAGADALVMSLWTVEDSAAREFMGALIRSRAVEARSPAGSVRQAALEFIAARRREGRTDHPFYWGAWISEGAAR